MLTIQDWLDAGYKRYNGNHFNNADFLLQRRFDDANGKKYFIDIWVYEYSNMPMTCCFPTPKISVSNW